MKIARASFTQSLLRCGLSSGHLRGMRAYCLFSCTTPMGLATPLIAWIGFSRACMPGVFGRESVGESIINSRANGGASKTESSLDKQAKASAVLLKTKTVHLLCNQTIGTGRGQYWLPNVQSLHMNPSLQSRSEVT